MKSLGLALVGLLGVALVNTSLAQDEAKLRRDVTYSTRNYKHPNKAAAASQWEPEASISFRNRSRRRVTIGDYKRTTARDVRTAGIILPVQSVPVVGRNYKAQQPRQKKVREQPVVNVEQEVEVVVESTGN